MNRTDKNTEEFDGHKVNGLFSNEYLEISEFLCNGKCTPANCVEVSQTFDIVLPRNGLFVRHLGKANHISDVNHITFFNRNEPYRINHPVPGGDRSTVVSLSAEVLESYYNFGRTDRRSRMPGRFPASHCQTTSAISLKHYHMLHLLGQQKVDRFLIENIIYTLGDLILTEASKYRDPEFNIKRASTLEFYRDKVGHTKVVIQESFRQQLTIDKISHLVAVSPFHLCRIFKLMTGISIYGYLKHLRLRASLEPLFDAEDNLTQLALDHGFSSHSHYSGAFKSEFGCSPSRFRQSVNSRIISKLARIWKR